MAETANPAEQRWQLTTLAGCELAIGRYPRFRYDARGGGGLSRSRALSSTELDFPAEQLQIPPLDWRSTRFLGLPLPPGLSIAIAPEQLHGVLDASSGHIQLQFRARFRFRISVGAARLYAAPDLLVETTLLSGPSQGQRHHASGCPLNASGEAQLVGIARVEASGEAWLDRFLGLPDEALAILRCRITRQP